MGHFRIRISKKVYPKCQSKIYFSEAVPAYGKPEKSNDATSVPIPTVILAMKNLFAIFQKETSIFAKNWGRKKSPKRHSKCDFSTFPPRK